MAKKQDHVIWIQVCICNLQKKQMRFIKTFQKMLKKSVTLQIMS